MAAGWIRLHRSVTEWEWYDDGTTMRVFLHLILTANHADKKWRGMTIKRGQCVTSSEKLGEALKMGRMRIRTALEKLESTNELTKQTSRKGTVISITNYDKYQQDNQQPNQQLTNDQPTANQQLTSNKNEKNYNNEKKESARAKENLIDDWILGNEAGDGIVAITGWEPQRVIWESKKFKAHHMSRGTLMRNWDAKFELWCYDNFEKEKSNAR